MPLRADGKERYKVFLMITERPRTLVVSHGGGWRFYSGPNSRERALEACNRTSVGCQMYAEDDRVVWKQR